MGLSINDVMSEGGGGVRVRMTNNVEGCIKKHDMGGGVKMPQNSMTSFMDDPYEVVLSPCQVKNNYFCT